jgi:hypothetical protein
MDISDYGFTSIDANHQEGLLCVLCRRVLVLGCMIPSKLISQLETDHPNMVSISSNYFMFGSCCNKKQVPCENLCRTGNEGSSV